jgi:O-antigen/teichoic acid export membrane protein
MTGLRRSLLFSTAERYCVTAINLALTVVLARLMSPEETGAFMVGLGVLVVSEAVRDFGMSVYLVQEPDVTPERARTTFTLMFAISILLALSTLALAGPIARFYGQERLEAFLHIGAAAFFVGPFSAPLYALLRRDMDFRGIALAGVIGAAINFTSAVILAVLGFGCLAVAWGSLAGGTASAASLVLYRPRLWLFRPTLAAWRHVLGFGSYATAAALLNQFYQLLPQFILGRMIGLDAVGLFSRAVWLCQLPERSLLSGVYPVILPALAEEARGGRTLTEPYLRAISYMTATQWPFLLTLALLADPAVKLLLGPQWSETAGLVRVVAVAWLAMFPAFLTHPVLVSVGRVRDTFVLSLISLPISAAVTFAAALLGLWAVAASLFLTVPLQVVVALIFVRRHVPFAWTDLAGATAKSAAVTAASAVAPAVAVLLSGPSFDLSMPVTFAAGAGAVLGWFAGLSLTRHPFLKEIGKALHALAGQKAVRALRLGRAATP